MNDRIIPNVREKAHTQAKQSLRPPLSAAAIVDAEASLGFVLPPLFRALYEEVADGGFGPGHGLFPLVSAPQGEQSVVDSYLASRACEDWDWPPTRLPFCDWGCGIASCLDSTALVGAVFTFEYSGGTLDSSFADTHDTLAAWLEDWLAGVDILALMYEDDPSRAGRVGINPFTKQPMTFPSPKRMRRRASVPGLLL